MWVFRLVALGSCLNTALQVTENEVWELELSLVFCLNEFIRGVSAYATD
jgi:hypothetical protein